MSVRRAQQEIDAAEFSEWIAYHKLNPFTVKTTDNVLAIIASMIGNALRKKGSKTLRPDDFLPKDRVVKREDAKVIEMKLKTIFGKPK